MPDPRDVEDIVQEVFSELVEANRKLMPIDHVTGWLIRVAQNRITDLFRKKQPERFSDAAIVTDDGETLRMEDLLPAGGRGTRCALRPPRSCWRSSSELLRRCPGINARYSSLTSSSGCSFAQIAADTGVNLNTLLSRKRYAVLFLRKRLQRAFNGDPQLAARKSGISFERSWRTRQRTSVPRWKRSCRR